MGDPGNNPPLLHHHMYESHFLRFHIAHLLELIIQGLGWQEYYQSWYGNF